MKMQEAFAISNMIDDETDVEILGQKTLEDDNVGLAIYNKKTNMGALIWSVEIWNTMVRGGIIKPREETQNFEVTEQRAFAMLVHLNEKMEVEDLAKEIGVTEKTMENWLAKEQAPNTNNRKKIIKLYMDKLKF
jgi:DNA-binding XRE family transcriptional regulator